MAGKRERRVVERLQQRAGNHMGLAVPALARPGVQRQLVLGEREHGWSDADRAVDLATRRFGSSAVRPASLLA